MTPIAIRRAAMLFTERMALVRIGGVRAWFDPWSGAERGGIAIGHRRVGALSHGRPGAAKDRLGLECGTLRRAASNTERVPDAEDRHRA